MKTFTQLFEIVHFQFFRVTNFRENHDHAPPPPYLKFAKFMKVSTPELYALTIPVEFGPPVTFQLPHVQIFIEAILLVVTTHYVHNVTVLVSHVTDQCWYLKFVGDVNEMKRVYINKYDLIVDGKLDGELVE